MELYCHRGWMLTQLCSICLVMNVNEDIKGNYSNVNPFICEVAKIKERNYLQRGC